MAEEYFGGTQGLNFLLGPFKVDPRELSSFSLIRFFR